MSVPLSVENLSQSTDQFSLAVQQVQQERLILNAKIWPLWNMATA
jgi:hypothetical protein